MARLEHVDGENRSAQPRLAQRHHRVADVGAEVAGIGGQVAGEQVLGRAAGAAAELGHRAGGGKDAAAMSSAVGQFS